MINYIWITTLVALMALSCNRPEIVDESTCGEYTTDKNQAQQWIVGSWKLTKLVASIPDPPVPNVELVITQTGIISVWEDGKLIDQVTYEITPTPYGTLLLKTDAQPRSDNWYVRNPSLQLCRVRMFLDTGMASDLPGFEFRRLTNR